MVGTVVLVQERRRQRVLPMDFRDRRIWYVVAAIIVLIIIGYAAGWFDGEPVPPVIPE